MTNCCTEYAGLQRTREWSVFVVHYRKKQLKADCCHRGFRLWKKECKQFLAKCNFEIALVQGVVTCGLRARCVLFVAWAQSFPSSPRSWEPALALQSPGPLQDWGSPKAVHATASLPLSLPQRWEQQYMDTFPGGFPRCFQTSKCPFPVPHAQILHSPPLHPTPPACSWTLPLGHPLYSQLAPVPYLPRRSCTPVSIALTGRSVLPSNPLIFGSTPVPRGSPKSSDPGSPEE